MKRSKKPPTKRVRCPLPFLGELVITIRKFKTSKEIAIKYNHKKRQQKQAARTKKSLGGWQKRLRFASAILLTTMGLSGAVYFGFQLTKTPALKPVVTNTVPVAEVTPPTAPSQPQALGHSEPIRLRIAKVGINTTALSVGRKADNTMQVPTRPDTVGWYKDAPTPGELGPAIIVGHVDSPKGPAVFWRLRELVPGDIVEIDRADGKTVKFKIDQVKQFAQDNFPTVEVYGNIEHSGIRLITCGGVFDRQSRHYSHNTVVFGSLVI